MFIQTEQTPNPASLKFLPGRDVLGSGTANFPDIEEARRSPLAERLFTIDGVTGVFFGADFVTVSKREDKDWYLLKPAVLGAIMEHFTNGAPIMADVAETGNDADHAPHAGAPEDDEIVVQIKELLDTRVRPAVAQDGGDITFQGYQDGVVFLTLKGACSGCPSSTMTLKAGIENLLRHYIPDVQEVRAAM